MPYKIEVLESLKLIKVIYLGDVCLDERLNIIHEICLLSRKLRKNFKILIDARLQKNNMSKTEQEIFGNFVSNVEELKNALVAVIINGNAVTNETAIKISSQLGHQIKTFNDESDAMHWLNN